MILIISRVTLEKNAWTYFWGNKLLVFIKCSLRNEFLSDTLYYRLSVTYVRMLANVAHGKSWIRDNNFRGWRMCLVTTNPYNDLPLCTNVSEHTGSSGNAHSYFLLLCTIRETKRLGIL
jgi:hypothetical protein